MSPCSSFLGRSNDFGKRSEDHFYEHVMYEENDEEIEFSDFRKAIDYCDMKGE